MINLISQQPLLGDGSRPTGPFKVFANLVKGLDRIGFPYVVNRRVTAAPRLWVHDWPDACYQAQRSKAHVVLGPNLWVMPNDIPGDLRLDGALYLHPCDWARQLWLDEGFRACPIDVWPVGIDTEDFIPTENIQARTHILVYHKDRDAASLKTVLDVVYALKAPFDLILYPYYRESEYKAALSRARLVLWNGRHESQGLALQEALACNVPVLVSDVRHLSESRGPNYVFGAGHTTRVTAAPYFDERCGLKVDELTRLREALEDMLARWREFTPRDYIVENLSLEGQAKRFVDLWGRWGEGGCNDDGAARRVAGEFSISLGHRVHRRLRRLLS